MAVYSWLRRTIASQRRVNLVISRGQNDFLTIQSSLLALFALIEIWFQKERLYITKHWCTASFITSGLHVIIGSVMSTCG